MENFRMAMIEKNPLAPVAFRAHNTFSGAVYTKGGTSLMHSKNWNAQLKFSIFCNQDHYEVSTVGNSIAFAHFVGHSKIRMLGKKEWSDWETGCLIGAPGWEQRLEGVGASHNRIFSIAPSFFEAAVESPIEYSKVEMIKAPKGDLRVIRYLLSALHADAQSTSLSGSLFAESVALALINHACPSLGMKSGVLDLSRNQIDIISDYIEEHLSDDLSLTRISLISGIPLRQLTSAFRKKYGQSIHQYVISRRVSRAIALLRLGFDLPETAKLTGFDGPTSVARALRSVHGTSPSAIRRSLL